MRFGNGPLDMLMNVAGIRPEPDYWYRHTSWILKDKFAVNAVGPFLVSKHFHQNLKKARGMIVNISSSAGSIANLGYRMSKAALNMLTVTLAKGFQMNGDNIAVIALNPDAVATRLTDFRSWDDSYG